MKHMLQLSLIILLCNCSYSQDNVKENQSEFQAWVNNQEDIVYSALFSVEETRSIVVDLMGISEDEMLSFSPGELIRFFDENRRERIVLSIIKMELETKSIQDRINAWMLSHNQLELFAELTNAELTMSAAFLLEPSKHLFSSVLENRHFNQSNVSPLTIGASLSSGEMSAITYELLNLLSTMDRAAQLTYFADFYGELYKLHIDFENQ